MLSIFSVKMISVAVSELAALLALAVAQWKKKAAETFCGIISVHIMHSPPDAINGKMKRILAIKFDQKDLVKR